MRVKKRIKLCVTAVLISAITVAIAVAFLSPMQAASESDSLTLININTIWKYRQENVDPAIGTPGYTLAGLRNGWTMPASPFMQTHLEQDYDAGYDDGAWLSAKGPFGFKLGSSTHLDSKIILTANRPGTTSRIPTYFFRTTFTVNDLSQYNQLYYLLRFDDAVIVYINGVEIGRHNTPAAGYPNNMSYGCVSAAGTYIEDGKIVTDLSMLREGENVLAVELHQSAFDSSDIYFNFMELSLGSSEKLKSLTVTPGSDESQLNFAWFSLSQDISEVEITDGNETEVFKSDGAPELSTAGYFSNKVTVTGLKPNTTYTYRVGNGDVWSSSYTITTGGAGSFSFLFAGDPQIGASLNVGKDTVGWSNTVKKSLEGLGKIDFIVSAGDQVDSANNEMHYDGYFNPVQLKSIPVATSVGNHDNTENYKYHFNLPNLDNTKGYTAAGGNYYFTYNGVLFMMLNANNMSAASHKTFMQNAIAASPDSTWRVVVFHQSIYTVAYHSTASTTIERRNSWVPVFDELGIDIVLMGHDHCYTRTYQMKGDVIQTNQTVNAQGQVVDPDGIIYLTVNSASGSKYYSIKNQEFLFAAKTVQLNVPTISKIDMTENTFTFKTYRLDTMAEVDSYSIYKTDTINRTLLKEAIDNASLLDLELYNTNSVDALESALADARTMYEKTDATQSEINSAKDALIAAMDNLILLPDRTQLNQKIGLATSLVQERYTAESYQALYDALNAASIEAASGITNEEKVSLAYNNLLNAIAGLQFASSPEVASLESAILTAEGMDLALYYDTGKQAFNSILALAKSEMQYATKTFAQLVSITEELIGCINDLILIPNKEELQALVNLCITTDKALFTNESTAALTDAINFAKSVLASDSSQEAVDSALNTLKQAFDSLIQLDPQAPPKVGDYGAGAYGIVLFVLLGACIAVPLTKRRNLLK